MNYKLGVFYGLFSAATFGLIPLFSLPLMNDGISVQTTLAYRFTLAAIIVSLILLFKKESLAIGWRSFCKISILSLFYMLAVVLFFYSFNYLPSGIVATIQFQYPVMVLLIMVIFFHEKFRWQTGLAVALAVVGVACLSINSGQQPAIVSSKELNENYVIIGVVLSLIAGLANGLYFVAIQVAKLPKMNGLVMTFYVMLFGALFCLINGWATDSLMWISTPPNILNAVLLALVTAVLSNLTLILAIREIGSTLTSILGVAEPLTAVTVGAVVFGETITLQIAIGIVLIISSVVLALAISRKPASEAE